jgi:peptidoglycan-associated lipoprotein
MATHLRSVLALVIAAPLAAGCATKGFVREQVQQSSAQQMAALEAERQARLAGDSTLSVDINALRADLQSLRTEFGAKITAMEEGVQFAFPVNFEFDDATIRSQDYAAIDRFSQVAQRHYAGSKITVEGFADPAGSAAYNVSLSRRRAESVRDYLLSKGLSEAQVNAVGYGESRQVSPGAERDDQGAEQNRRVVFVIESRGTPMISQLLSEGSR